MKNFFGYRIFQVEGNYRGKGKWYPGKITRDRRDGTFDIAYDDGESETRVDELLIRIAGGSSSAASSFYKFTYPEKI